MIKMFSVVIININMWFIFLFREINVKLGVC